MNDVNYLALVQNTALLLAAALVFDISSLNFKEGDSPSTRRQGFLEQVIYGLLLGAICIAVMLTPWQVFPGIRIDTRSVLLGIAGVFFGPIPTLIAMAIATVFRLFLGGAGVLAGLLIILTSGLIGIAWRRFRKTPLAGIRWYELYMIGVVIHLVMVACLLTLPRDSSMEVISTISLPVLVLFPVGTALLGIILRNRLRRKRVVDELFHTTKRLNETQFLTKMGGWEYDVEKQSMFWSDEVFRIHDMAVNQSMNGSRELIELSLSCYAPESRTIIENAFRDCCEKGLPYDLELPFTTSDGDHLWVRTEAQAIEENGKIVRLVGNIMDITEKKLADLALKKSESDYRRIVDTANEGIWALDKDFKTSFVNPHMAVMLGYEPEEMIGHLAEEYMFPEDHSQHHQHMVERQKGKSAKYEQKFMRKDGSEVWTIVSAIPLLDEHGGHTGSFGMVTDITERKMAENSLRQSNETIRAILNAATESVFLMDLDGTVIDSNDVTAHRLGVDPSALIGKNMYDLLPPEVVEKRRSALERVAREAIPIQFQDQRNGIWIENHIYPIIDSNREIHRVAIIGIDITSRKNAERELHETQDNLRKMLDETRSSRQALLSVIEDQKEADEKIQQLNEELEERVRERTVQLEAVNRELESFSYSVSHDLRTPLRALHGFSDALMTDYEDKLDQQGQAYLKQIQEASLLMGKLIDDLLNLSRISRCEINISSVDLSQFAGEICSDLASRNPNHAAKFNIMPGLTAQADPSLIRIALTNLIQNALKYSSKRQESIVEFGILNPHGQQVFFIRDNGAGFNMDYVGKLFTPFQRLHKASDFSGTGIGLSIVKRIINRHHGRIWAEAVINQGATFYFTLWENGSPKST